MGYQALMTAVAWLFIGSLAHAGALPAYAEKFPFPCAITTYGEMNGSRFFSARGVVRDTPRVAVERLQHAFGSEWTFAQSSPNGNHGVFWQLRGMKTPAAGERKKFRASLERLSAAMALKIEARTAAPPVGTAFWLFDLLCSLHVITAENVCAEILPLDIAIVMDAALPKPQWHGVTLERKADGTHFSWTLWPEANLTSLFGMGSLAERKLNCRRKKHPLPADSDCLIVGRFINNASAGRVEIAHSILPLDAVEKYIGEQLQANGWGTDPLFDSATRGELSTLVPSLTAIQGAMTVPGFQFLRHAASGATLLVKCQKGDEGTQIFYIEMEAGA